MSRSKGRAFDELGTKRRAASLAISTAVKTVISVVLVFATVTFACQTSIDRLFARLRYH